MDKELTLQMQEWIEKEAVNSEKMLASARKKNMQKLPVWMAVCIVGMIALGFVAGMGVQGVLKLHLPIGIGLALFSALFTVWQQKSILNKKIIIKAYIKGAASEFANSPEQNQSLFCHQMSDGRYEEVEYSQSQIPFPSKVIVGSDYWVYRNHVMSVFVKVSDVSEIHLAKTKVRMSYDKGNTQVKKNAAVGVELVVDYKENSSPKKISPCSVMFFDNNEQASQVLALIKKHCPQIGIDI